MGDLGRTACPKALRERTRIITKIKSVKYFVLSILSLNIVCISFPLFEKLPVLARF
jgi:hypothetical protein